MKQNMNMNKAEITKLKKLAIQVRRDVIRMIYGSKDGHIGAAMSIVEMLVVLYSKILKIDQRDLSNKERDRFILSKGHGCVSLYSVLARRRFFPMDELEKFCTRNGILGGHPDHNKIPGVEVSTGSLGHGFPMGVGFAMAAKLEKSHRRVFCVVGDGECNEGSTWEAAAIASHQKLDNLVVILDNNEMQSSGSAVAVQDPHDLKLKWSAFGWETLDVEGHDINKIYGALIKCPLSKDRPAALIAHTVKAKGIPFMENDNKWHTGIPTEKEYLKAMEEINLQEKLL